MDENPDFRAFPRIAGAIPDVISPDADANARQTRHYLHEQVNAIRCIAHEMRTGRWPPPRELFEEWMDGLDRSIEGITAMAVRVRKLPPQPPPPAPTG